MKLTPPLIPPPGSWPRRRLLRAVAVATVVAVLSSSGAHAAAPLAEPASQAGQDNADRLLARYRLAQEDGETAANEVAGGPPARLENGAAWTKDSGTWVVHTGVNDSGGTSTKLDGVDDQVTTSVSVATNQSFTVMAQARVAANGRTMVVLSQDGSRASGFVLRTEPDGTWSFALPSSDADNAAWNVVRGPKAAPGAWARLAGVYDATTQEARLYVNGVRAGATPHKASWLAKGSVQIGRGMSAGRPADHFAGNLTQVGIYQRALSDAEIADQTVDPYWARFGRCRLGEWAQVGGRAIKDHAIRGLAGTDFDRRQIVPEPKYIELAPLFFLGDARSTDEAEARALRAAYDSRREELYDLLSSYGMFWVDHFGSVQDVPSDGDQIFDMLRIDEGELHDNAFKARALPEPNAAALERALAIGAEVRQPFVKTMGPWAPPTESTIRSLSAYRIERFIRYGGRLTPETRQGYVPPLVKDSPDFRLEVESIKALWAACDTPDAGLTEEATSTAAAEWNAELAAQASQRNTIMVAEAAASLQLRSAALELMYGQLDAWMAGKLLRWQKHWVGKAQNDPTYPQPETFAKVSRNLADSRSSVEARLKTAQQAAAAAQVHADKVTAALAEAADIAKSNGYPVYRGLAYARQSAQVARAAAAATQSAVKALEATLNAVKTNNATSETLQALVATQQAALRAEFRRVAAQEAARQAKAAAEAANVQADLAAAAATRAKNARPRAERAEAQAKTSAESADRNRQVADAEARKASESRKQAETERAKAKDAEARARDQQAVAEGSRANADAAAQTASEMRRAAEQSEKDAAKSRDDAFEAERRRDSFVARAEAMEAKADAAESEEAAEQARAAANNARSEADVATDAARKARAAATEATEAAAAARAAATRSAAAAERSRAAAERARADAATTRAHANASWAAASEAIQAAEQAARNAQEAQKQAKIADSAASSAQADATTARRDADTAETEGARAVGAAYAASEAAVAARDAAVVAVQLGNDAIVLGTPFQASDASAGLAVLVGQTSKTVAEQQSATADAKAAEAARAAQVAKDAATNANADAKAAADAASAAAADAASAADAVKRTHVSAAAAAKDAEAAHRSATNATQYHLQAEFDAFSADQAAKNAQLDASAARSAATDAEKDAASARDAATQAEKDAAGARDAAARADRDATAAEGSAANAKQSADEAQEAADRTERAERSRRDAEIMAGTGPLKVPNVRAVTTGIQDDARALGPCQQVMGTKYCKVDVRHHVTGYVDFFLSACADPKVASCPGKEVDYFLGRERIDQTFTQTHHIDLVELSVDIWKSVGRALVADYINCWEKRDAASCGRAVESAVLDLVSLRLSTAARAVSAFRVAANHSDDVEDSLAALRAAKVDPATIAKLEREAAESIVTRCLTGAGVVGARSSVGAQTRYALNSSDGHADYVAAGGAPQLAQSRTPGCGSLWMNRNRLPHHYMSENNNGVMHARDFGVVGPYNRENAEKFIKAIEELVKHPRTIKIRGTWRKNTEAIHYVDPETGLHASFEAAGPRVGEYLGGWRSSGEQLEYLLRDGKL